MTDTKLEKITSPLLLETKGGLQVVITAWNRRGCEVMAKHYPDDSHQQVLDAMEQR